jgi:uncharacterized tellurite resistance protein B-like protein
MHIILGFLGSVITVLWLLHRLGEMGIDLGGLNPFLWRRRRNWRKTYQTNPIFKLENPMDVTALLIVATAKADGDMSAEEKKEILVIFEQEFQLAKRDAAGLFISSSHMLGTGDEVRNSLKNVLAPSLGRFNADQAASAIELMRRIAAVNGVASEVQLELMEKVSDELIPRTQPAGKWSATT